MGTFVTVREDLQVCITWINFVYEVIGLGFAMQVDDRFIFMLNGIRTGENPAVLKRSQTMRSGEFPLVDGIKPKALFSK